jgi:hypothetical protein
MKKAVIEIYYGLKSLFVGLRITLGQFFRPLVTVQYPHETLKILGPQNSQPPVAGGQPAIGGTPAPSAPAPLAELKPEAK